MIDNPFLFLFILDKPKILKVDEMRFRLEVFEGKRRIDSIKADPKTIFKIYRFLDENLNQTKIGLKY